MNDAADGDRLTEPRRTSATTGELRRRPSSFPPLFRLPPPPPCIYFVAPSENFFRLPPTVLSRFVLFSGVPKLLQQTGREGENLFLFKNSPVSMTLDKKLNSSPLVGNSPSVRLWCWIRVKPRLALSNELSIAKARITARKCIIVGRNSSIDARRFIKVVLVVFFCGIFLNFSNFIGRFRARVFKPTPSFRKFACSACRKRKAPVKVH